MKKLLLATAVAALTSTAAQAAPTVYGKAGVKTTYDTKNEDVKLDNFNSRIGFKGSEELGAGVKAVYQFEYGLNVLTDTKTVDAAGNAIPGTSAEFGGTKRDSFIGLEDASFGSLKYGRQTLPDGNVNFSTKSGAFGDYVRYSGHEYNRVDNAFVYSTPDIAGLNASAFYVYDNEENKGASKDHFGVVGTYDAGVAQLGASYVDNGKNATFIRVSAGTKVEMVSAGVTYILEDHDGTDKNVAQFGAGVDLGAANLYGQVDYAKVKDADAALAYEAGVNYSLTGSTSLHGFVAYDEAEVTHVGTALLHNF